MAVCRLQIGRQHFFYNLKPTTYNLHTYMTLERHIRAAAARLANSETPLLDARVLMKFATGLDDAGLIAQADAALTPEQHKKFDDAIRRRAGGEPVAYITGVKEFWSLEFQVAPDVLIPRADSECLIVAALARREKRSVYRILDLGTGSGCLLCALLFEMPSAFGIGVDRAPGAAARARANARRLQLSARAAFLAGDWAAAVSGRFDIVIANPPYIRDADIPGLAPDIRRYEPAVALAAGPDGLDAHRAILADGARLLAPQGLFILECGADQAGALAEMVAKTFPGREIAVITDLEGRLRGVLTDAKSPVKKD